MSGNTVTINWEFIIDKLKAEQCLLVLGPEAYVAANGSTLQDELIRQLALPNNENIQKYYEEDGFFLFDDPYKRTLACHQIKAFYRSAQPGETIRQIAQLPFHVILTVTPDKVLPAAFEQLNFSFQFGHYKKNKDPQPIKAPTAALPLIYNVFGCTDNEESMVLTHNDLYDYFKSIFARNSMPGRLSLVLQEVKNIIFLGVPFEQWYFQLLLRELGIHQQQYEFTRFAASQSATKELRTFCYEQFKINFIANHIDGFIQELFNRCRQEGLLRREGVTPASELDKVKKLVAKGDMEQAIDLLMDYTDGTTLEDDVAHLAGRYRKFKKRAMKGVLYQEEKTVQEAQLIEAILEIATEAGAI